MQRGLTQHIGVASWHRGTNARQQRPPRETTWQPLSIGDVVAWSDRLSVLAAAVRAARLESVLDACGAVTLLAPSDRAFGQLPEGTIERLMQPEHRDELRSLLLGHLTPGQITAARLQTTEQLMTPQGTTLPVRRNEGTLQVGDAAIEWADVEASNGVIHIIDRVLLPQGEAAYVA